MRHFIKRITDRIRRKPLLVKPVVVPPKKFQKSQGEQEYMMLFEIDMPKILKAFTEYLLNGA